MDEVTEGTPVEDQPAEVTEAPPEGTSAEGVESFTDIDPAEKPDGDYTPEWLQERYKQMQADYTRKRQAESETARERQEELEFLESLRSDRETQQAVFEQLQELLAESEGDNDEYELGEEEPANELERTVRELQAKEEERQASALASNIVSHIEQLAKDASVELDEDDLSEIFNGAISGDDVSGQVTEAAFERWQGRRSALHDKWQKSYLASKQSPTQLPAGQSAQDKPDLSTQEGRIRQMAAILQGGQA